MEMTSYSWLCVAGMAVSAILWATSGITGYPWGFAAIGVVYFTLALFID